VTLKALATHKKGIYTLWKFIASGTLMRVAGLSLEKIAPIGELLLNSLVTQSQCDNARKRLEEIDIKVYTSLTKRREES